MSEFLSLPNLASAYLGAQAIDASDEFFAEKENLVKDSDPIFIADRYTQRGKWMDGWESRRNRTPQNHDWCVLKLAAPSQLMGFDVDTSHFTGNFPESASLEGLNQPTSSDWNRLSWTELSEKVLLKGGSHNYITSKSPQTVTHIRLNSFPDGGIARFRAYGRVVPRPVEIGREVELAGLLEGGEVVSASDMYFGHQVQLIYPGHSSFMGGGWETKRRRGPGFDWIIVKLARGATLSRIEIDTDHYFGNYPEMAWIDGLQTKATDFKGDLPWTELVPRNRLQANFRHRFEVKSEVGKIEYVRLSISPDGGVARMRVYGRVQN